MSQECCGDGWSQRPGRSPPKAGMLWCLFNLAPPQIFVWACKTDTHLTLLTKLHLLLQAALLNSFPTVFDELLQMFTVQEVAEFVRGTLGSMPSTVHIGQSMDVVKLQSIARTVDSRLFSFSGKSNWDKRLTFPPFHGVNQMVIRGSVLSASCKKPVALKMQHFW